MSQRRILAYGFLATVAVVVLTVIPAPVFSFLALRLYDTVLRASPSAPASGRVVIVAIDDRSLSRVGQWPWPRDVVARLVERLRSSGAAVIALDLLLAEPDRFDSRSPGATTGETDAALAAALGGGRVVLGYAMTFGSEPGASAACELKPLDLTLVQSPRDPAGASFFHASGVMCGLPVLMRAAEASGYVNAGPDRDGLLRRIPLLMQYEGNFYPSLALAAVRHATSVRHVTLSPAGVDRANLIMDGRSVPLDERGTLLIRFREKRGNVQYVSAADVLDGAAAPDAVRGRLVFVGATALGTGDVVATPFEISLPGIEVHAAAAETLLQGDFIVTPPNGRAYELLAAVCAGMVSAALIALAGPFTGAALSGLLLLGLWRAAVFGMTSAGLFVSPLFPALSVLSTVSVLTVARIRYERRRAESERGRRKQAHQFTVHSLTSLVETRDGSTGQHARRTEQYSRLLATRLAVMPRFRERLTPEHVDLIARLAPLHDLGKIGVRDAVLNKTGPLSAEEFDEMRQHPDLGHETLASAERLAYAAGGLDEALIRVAKDIVYTHHERWDGKGYPRGLKGDDIPIGGRIMALVDVYDALIAARPYRGGGTHDDAVSIIRAGRGTHFDPDVVDAFLSVEEDFRRLTDGFRDRAGAVS